MIEFKTELLKMTMKIMDYCESNKQMGRACAFEDHQYEVLQTPRKNYRPPGRPRQMQEKCR